MSGRRGRGRRLGHRGSGRATRGRQTTQGLVIGRGTVCVSAGGRQHEGVVRFVGETSFAPGSWVGVELATGDGKNDGSVDGVRYFEQETGGGARSVFVRPNAVEILSPAGDADTGVFTADGDEQSQVLGGTEGEDATGAGGGAAAAAADLDRLGVEEIGDGSSDGDPDEIGADLSAEEVGDDFSKRARGCLVGLATCDALGAAVEFKVPGSFEPVTGMRGGGPHGLRKGYWSGLTLGAGVWNTCRIKGNQLWVKTFGGRGGGGRTG